MTFKAKLSKVRRYYELVLVGHFVAKREPRIHVEKHNVGEQGKKFYRCYWDLAFYLGKLFDVTVYKDKAFDSFSVLNAMTVVGHPDDVEYFFDHYYQIRKLIEDFIEKEKIEHDRRALRIRRTVGGVAAKYYSKSTSNNRIKYLNTSIELLKELLEKKIQLPNNRDGLRERELMREQTKVLNSKLYKQKLNGPSKRKSYSRVNN